MLRELLKKPVPAVQHEPEKQKALTQTTKTPAIPITAAQIQRAKVKLEHNRVQLLGLTEQSRLKRNARVLETARIQRKERRIQRIASERQARVQRALEVQAKQQAFFSSFVKSPVQRSALQSVKNASIEVSSVRSQYQAAIVPEMMQRLVDSEMSVQAQQARATQKPNELITRADWFNTELPCPS